VALTVIHTTQTVVPDDGTSPVGADEWNEAHSLSGTLPVANGGTGSTTAPDAISALGGLSADVEDQTITGGAYVTSKSLGTVSSGTLTPDPGDRPMQHYTNNGAHTLAPGSSTGSYFLDIVNGAAAGSITTSGWTFVAGDSLTTTNADKFRCSCSIGSNGSLLVVQAMQ
jgi:hypothetical protein